MLPEQGWSPWSPSHRGLRASQHGVNPASWLCCIALYQMPSPLLCWFKVCTPGFSTTCLYGLLPSGALPLSAPKSCPSLQDCWRFSVPRERSAPAVMQWLTVMHCQAAVSSYDFPHVCFVLVAVLDLLKGIASVFLVLPQCLSWCWPAVQPRLPGVVTPSQGAQYFSVIVC